jgi:hypothetical protein
LCNLIAYGETDYPEASYDKLLITEEVYGAVPKSARSFEDAWNFALENKTDFRGEDGKPFAGDCAIEELARLAPDDFSALCEGLRAREENAAPNSDAGAPCLLAVDRMSGEGLVVRDWNTPNPQILAFMPEAQTLVDDFLPKTEA